MPRELPHDYKRVCGLFVSGVARVKAPLDRGFSHLSERQGQGPTNHGKEREQEIEKTLYRTRVGLEASGHYTLKVRLRASREISKTNISSVSN
jgi:hypothetical protein